MKTKNKIINGCITIKVNGGYGIETVKNANVIKGNKGWKAAKKDGIYYISKDGRVYMEVNNDNPAINEVK